LTALDCIDKIFKINLEEKIGVFKERLNNLTKSYLEGKN